MLARVRSLWRALSGRAPVEAEMDAEFRHHMTLRAEDLVRGGLSPAEAARTARLEFGIAERYKHEGRKARGLLPFDALGISWLDLKLGGRMLVRYPGLAVVGGLAVALAVATGVGAFEVNSQLLHPKLPLPDGDRVVALRLWNAATSRTERRTLHEFAAWRAELRSVQELGAYRTVERNLIGAPGAQGEPVIVAEISASAFRLAHAAPLLGRALTDADERPGAPNVVAVGYDVWRTRLAADPAVVGRELRLGETRYTIVGVMPKGFAFPSYHDMWLPFRLNPDDYAATQGPDIARVFGRLAPGVTFDAAQAELGTIGLRRAADLPTTHAGLRPQVLPFARASLGLDAGDSLFLLSVNLFLAMLIVLVFGNVALLLFARAATRVGEITVRSALGATRGRVVMQLFAEALVLGGVGATVGLAAAGAGLRWGLRAVASEGTRLPFWVHDTLAPATIVWAAALTVLGAAIAGVMPGLKLTRGLQARLRASAAGGGGVRFGGVWTAVIVGQVAVTVAFPVAAFFTRRDAVQVRTLDVGFAAEHYLSARLRMDRERPLGTARDTGAALAARFDAARAALERRLEAEPGVAGATFTTMLPGADHSQRRVEVEGATAGARADSAEAPRVSGASVAADYFETLGAPVLAGRGFDAGDLASDARPVVVNRAFVRDVLGGGNAVGRRLRWLDPEDTDEPRRADWVPGPWSEIVGVVPDLGMTDGSDPTEHGAGIYFPLAPGASGAVHVVMRVQGAPAALAPRLRAAAVAADPTLRADRITTVSALRDAAVQQAMFWFRLIVTVSAIALGLSLAGIYAVMSFTVAQRTREIGVRVALGSDPHRVAAAIFRRPLTQVGLGVLAGAGLVAVLVRGVLGPLSAPEMGLIGAYAALMMVVCLLACVVPTRRALGVQPTVALRAE